MIIQDIAFGPEFWKEYEKLPKDVRQRFDRRLKQILVNGKTMPSDNAHKAAAHGELWIAYITQHRSAFRYLFTLTPEGVMVIENIGNHDYIEKVLRTITGV